MRMRIRWLTLSLTGLGLLAWATTAQAQGPDVPHGPMLLQVAQMIGLSPNQVAQIKKIALAAEREKVSVHAKLRMAQIDLQEAMEADTPPPEKKAAALVDRVGQLETQEKKNHVLMMLRIRSTMNKTQWDKLQMLHAEHEGPRSPGGPRPPGPPRPPLPPGPPPRP